MDDPALSRRERQIMSVIYRLGEATAVQVVGEMADAPSRTAVRTFLRILEDKGHLSHRSVGKEYVYKPVRPRAKAARSALREVLATFFGASLEQAVAAHLSDPRTSLTDEELARLEQLIADAKSQKGN